MEGAFFTFVIVTVVANLASAYVENFLNQKNDVSK